MPSGSGNLVEFDQIIGTGGVGNVISFAQDIVYKGSGNLVEFEQTINSASENGQLITIKQRVREGAFKFKGIITS